MDHLTEREAAALALALVAVSTASLDGGDDAQQSSERGLIELVNTLCDEPLSARQAEVVSALAVSSAAMTTGLSGAVAEQRRCDAHDVLRVAARAVLEHAHDGNGRSA